MKRNQLLIVLAVCAAAASAASDALANHCAAQWRPVAERITRAAQRFDESIDRRDRIMGCRQVDIMIDGYRFWDSLPKHCIHQGAPTTPTSQLIAKWERIKANNCRPDQLARAREEARQRGGTAIPGKKPGGTQGAPRRTRSSFGAAPDCVKHGPVRERHCPGDDSVTIGVYNGCGRTIETRICILTRKGKSMCGNYTVAHGRNTSHFVCWATGRYSVQVR